MDDTKTSAHSAVQLEVVAGRPACLLTRREQHQPCRWLRPAVGGDGARAWPAASPVQPTRYCTGPFGPLRFATADILWAVRGPQQVSDPNHLKGSSIRPNFANFSPKRVRLKTAVLFPDRSPFCPRFSLAAEARRRRADKPLAMPLHLLSSPAAAKLAPGVRAIPAPLRRGRSSVPAPPPHHRPLLSTLSADPVARVSLSAAAAARSAGPAMAAAEAKHSVSVKKQVLISLSDKTDLDYLGNGLQSLGYSIISTGGTASSLESAGVKVTKVEEITNFPEMLDGRVKTLHPSIHGGILARRDQEHHLKALKEHGIGTFDVVVVNLYPFYDKVTSGAISFEDGIENIDIGGPTLIRAAAKNHKDVLVVVDHEDYPALLEYLKGNKEDQEFRKMLAWKAFQHVASYDSAVSEWLWKQSNKGDTFPPSFTVPLEMRSTLRYGENPHQEAAFYADKSLSLVGAGGIATAIQHHGKEMSYNNYLDADAAWNCVSEFSGPTCVVVKHTNPCGVASRKDILEAYRLAVRADPISAFGGIVAFNTTIDEDLAKEIREFRSPNDGQTRMFYEIVIAPSYTEKGLEILRGKSKTLRILEAKRSGKGMLSLRQVNSGWLAQESDDRTPEDITFTTKSKRVPQESELSDAKFAWLCAKHVKSNAIVIAKNNFMLGMGSGQPNRRESLRIALKKAGEEAKGAALASDAFFPFAWNDAVEEACQNGIGIIAQPGGSMRDDDSVDCCDKYGVALVFTGVRHFRH